MLRNRYMLDANAVLRFLLRDNEEQFCQVEDVIRKNSCYVALEVMAEVCYVLEGVYQVSRKDIAVNLRRLNYDVTIINADVFLRALEVFENLPKLDFVDCLLYGYKMERDIDVVTFDKLLKKQLLDIEKL